MLPSARTTSTHGPVYDIRRRRRAKALVRTVGDFRSAGRLSMVAAGIVKEEGPVTAAVGENVEVNEGVGASVGGEVNAEVGEGVGCRVGENVGARVDEGVGAIVGGEVAAAVGEGVGCRVGE